MGKLLGFVIMIAVLILIVAIGPLATIWAFNTLFPSLNIGYTIETWVAVVIIGAFVRAKVSISKT